MKWLVLDCNFLCYRYFYTLKELAYEGKPTGVAFGMFRDLCTFEDLLGSDQFVFCFDFGKSKRKEIFPDYKSARAKQREEQTPLEKRQRQMFLRQVDALREELLERVGLRNVFFQKGYEADDLIASTCRNLKPEDTAVIISSDHDLYQCLNDRVSLWNPNTKKGFNAEDLRRDFNVEPKQWHKVKAMAGCKSDNIPGIKGIGEKTAAKLLRIDSDHPKFSIIEEHQSQIAMNLELTKLPFPGTKKCKPKRQKVDRDAWFEVLDELGITKIEGFIPHGMRRRRRGKEKKEAARREEGFSF